MKEMILKNQENQPKEYSVCFLECVEELGKETIILSSEESESIYDELQDRFRFTQWGRIDWDNIEDKKTISDISEIVSIIQNKANLNSRVFVLWGYGEEPVIQTDLMNVVRNIDDVTVVGGDQWIYSSEHNYVVELFHNGEITLGFSKQP